MGRPPYNQKLSQFVWNRHHGRHVRLERLLMIAYYHLDNEAIKEEIVRELDGRKNAGSHILRRAFMRKHRSDQQLEEIASE